LDESPISNLRGTLVFPDWVILKDSFPDAGSSSNAKANSLSHQGRTFVVSTDQRWKLQRRRKEY
jgi:hypothetical protein